MRLLLDTGMPFEELAGFSKPSGIRVLEIDERHAATAAEPPPVTRDPFDRMLLAQCAI